MVLQSLKALHLSIIPNRFYESPKLKNWMCELCTFSQIWTLRSQIYIYIYIFGNYFLKDNALLKYIIVDGVWYGTVVHLNVTTLFITRLLQA